MKVTFNLSAEFRRHFKRLAKKYPSLVNDYDTFKKELCKNPFQVPTWVVEPVRYAWPLLRKAKERAARHDNLNIEVRMEVILTDTKNLLYVQGKRAKTTKNRGQCIILVHRPR